MSRKERLMIQILKIFVILLIIAYGFYIFISSYMKGQNSRERETKEYKSQVMVTKDTLTTLQYYNKEQERIRNIEESAENKTKTYENKKLTKLGIDISIQHAVKGWSDNTGINESLIYAIIEYESSFNPNQYSNGDYGLMQVNQINVDYYNKIYQGNIDPYDINDNIYMGCQVLKNNYNKNNLHYSLMCYNMGKKKTDELNNNGIYKSKYSKKILDSMKRYEKILNE